MDLGVEISKLTLAFMVLINPFGALSIYPDLTYNHNMKERRKIISVAALTVFIIITIFALTGGFLLKLLGISVSSSQVGGGILVLLIAIFMTNSNSNPAESDLGISKEAEATVQRPKDGQNISAITVVPTAISMMVGSNGTLTMIIYASAAKNCWDIISITTADLLINLICCTVLMASSYIDRFLDDTGLTVLDHIMGVLLAIVSMEIAMAGLKTTLPQLIS